MRHYKLHRHFTKRMCERQCLHLERKVLSPNFQGKWRRWKLWKKLSVVFTAHLLNMGMNNTFSLLIRGQRKQNSKTFTILVPRGRVPFGQHQESRTLGRSNTVSLRLTDFSSLCACPESSLANLIGWEYATITLRILKKIAPSQRSRFMVIASLRNNDDDAKDNVD